MAELVKLHIEDLRRSGLSDAQIAKCGFYSVREPERIAAMLGWDQPARGLGPCLCIPFRKADGQFNGYARLKPQKPRRDKKTGKAVKYESPKGSVNRAYFPPGTVAKLHDAAVPLVITEGEMKAARADQDGFACIGLVGTYGWQKKRAKGADGQPAGPRELIDDLAAIPWEGRTVYVVFDSDAADKVEVRWAEWHLAQALAARGAKVLIVRLPGGEVVAP